MDTNKLQDRVQQLHARYALDFAGHPRITRDAALLSNLIAEGEKLCEELREADRAAEADALKATLERYSQELDAIKKAQAEGGRDAMEASDLEEFMQLFNAQYARYFAGQNRATRDLGLLDELLSEMQRISSRLDQLSHIGGPEIANTQRIVQQMISLYQSERDAIAKARIDGTLEVQADVLARVANDQFALYSAQFAGKPRLSRRPALLERIINVLKDLVDRMNALEEQGLKSEANEKNRTIINSHISDYQRELDLIRSERQVTSFDALVGALGEAANVQFKRFSDEFAGKPRKDCDLNALAQICDGLFDAARQMDELDRVREDAMNERNRRLVIDRLRLYTSEFDMIRKAKTQA